jgi:hypothetical protein
LKLSHQNQNLMESQTPNQDPARELPPLKKKKQSISKLSKADSTLADLHLRLRALLGQIAEAANSPMPDGALDPQVPAELLSGMDAMMRVDIRVYTNTGEKFRVTGLNTLPHILSDGMHAEAARNFEELFHSMVTRPTLNRFNSFLNEFTKPAHYTQLKEFELPSHTEEDQDDGNNADKGYIADI